MTAIKGYRQLSQDEIDLMNESKALGEKVGLFIERVNEGDNDKRWSDIAKTDLQKGFMALNRSIAKPNGF